MTDHSKQILEETLANMKLGDVHTFAHNQLIKLLEERVRNLKEEVEHYQNKYQISREEANTKFHELIQFDMMEKEDDLMQWEDAEYFLNSFINTVNKLENA